MKMTKLLIPTLLLISIPLLVQSKVLPQLKKCTKCVAVSETGEMMTFCCENIPKDYDQAPYPEEPRRSNRYSRGPSMYDPDVEQIYNDFIDNKDTYLKQNISETELLMLAFERMGIPYRYLKSAQEYMGKVFSGDSYFSKKSARAILYVIKAFKVALDATKSWWS